MPHDSRMAPAEGERDVAGQLPQPACRPRNPRPKLVCNGFSDHHLFEMIVKFGFVLPKSLSQPYIVYIFFTINTIIVALDRGREWQICAARAHAVRIDRSPAAD
jgi:hypothetical protein